MRAPSEWTRAHIISPFINGAQGFVVFLVIVVVQGQQGLRTLLEQEHMLYVILGVVGVILLASVVFVVTFFQWRVNLYRVTDSAVEQRRGLLFKQQRQARLDRLQAVDVVQPFLARIFGFAELSVEVAGGEKSGVQLKFLRLAHAEQLRNHILHLASGTAEKPLAIDADDVGVDPVAELSPLSQSDKARAIAAQASPAREVYKVPVPRLLLSTVLTWRFILAILIPVVFVVALLVAGNATLEVVREVGIADDIAGAFTAIATAALAALGVTYSYLSRGFNFTAQVAADGIRLRHGMLDTRRQTVPPGRVQAIRLRQHLLWRRGDWWRVSINVAGYQDNQTAVSTLLPVGTRQEALEAVWLVLPDLGDPDPEGTFSAALSGKGEENDFTATPVRSAWFDPLQWRYRGTRATDRALLIRRGWLTREVFVVPHERTQSLGIRQGPLQRLLSLADVHVHSTNGPVRPVAQHMDVEDARELLEAQAERATLSRAVQTPDQWARIVGVPQGTL